MEVLSRFHLLLFVFSSGILATSATEFTVVNKCSYPIWPGTLKGTASAPLAEGGFKLEPTKSFTFPVPPTRSARLWARTGCIFDNAGSGKCATGDCGGSLKCTVSGEVPASLVEFTVGMDDKDTYDVSLVDGFNVGVGVKPVGGTGDCRYTSCAKNLNDQCPEDLRVPDAEGKIVGCKSACAVFNKPEYCCTGDHSTEETCLPTDYSKVFKNACPMAYSYAKDDRSSTFTCVGSNYLVTFCPSPN